MIWSRVQRGRARPSWARPAGPVRALPTPRPSPRNPSSLLGPPAIPRSRHSRSLSPFPVRPGLPSRTCRAVPAAGGARAAPAAAPGSPAAAVRGGPGRRHRRGREGEESLPRFADPSSPAVCCPGVVFCSTEPLKQCLNCRWFAASTPRSFMLIINSSIQRLVELGVFCVCWRRLAETLEPLTVAKGPSRKLERDFGEGLG